MKPSIAIKRLGSGAAEVTLRNGYTKAITAEFMEARTRPDPDGCWRWTGSVGRDGYGRIPVRGSSVLATRVAYTLNVTHIPDGLYICHHCDNPTCVNPEHLYAGTHEQNMRDMTERGRRVVPYITGMECHSATVPPEKIRAAVTEYLKGGISQEAAGRQVGVSSSTFSRWVRAQNRKDSGLTGVNVGVGSRLAIGWKPCGTKAAAARHRFHGEPLCDACRKAVRESAVAERARRKQRVA